MLNNKTFASSVACCCIFVFASFSLFSENSLAAAKRDLDLERIQATLAQLDADPNMSNVAVADLARAREAVRAMASNTDKKKRAHLIYIAERRIEIARVIAEASKEESRLVALGNERDEILLRASRRDAELARLEAEKLRLQNLARQEETERMRQAAELAQQQNERSTQAAEAARAEAEQQRRVAEAQAEEADLARREAELATAAMGDLQRQMQELQTRQDARGKIMTLGDLAFAPNKSNLQPEVLANLDKVIDFVNQDNTRKIRIEGHTDSRGEAAANMNLSKKRADAVRSALTKKGVTASRMVAIGMGEDQAIASNETEVGRAKNRRVDIILLGAE